MKAVFGRKVENLEELRFETNLGQQGYECKVEKEVHLSDTEFETFARDFFAEQTWLTKEDGGCDKEGRIRCTRVLNKKTGESVLVNNEGYDYPRYTALEQK